MSEEPAIIRRVKLLRGLTDEQLADIAALFPPEGRRTVLHGLSDIQQLADLLGVSVSDIIDE